jgi:hypothetical protein
VCIICLSAMMQIVNYVNTVRMYRTVIACILAHFWPVQYKLYKATVLYGSQSQVSFHWFTYVTLITLLPHCLLEALLGFFESFTVALWILFKQFIFCMIDMQNTVSPRSVINLDWSFLRCLFKEDSSHLHEKIFQVTSSIWCSKRPWKRHMLRKNQMMVLELRHH